MPGPDLTAKPCALALSIPEKPLSLAEVLLAVKNALEHSRLRAENAICEERFVMIGISSERSLQRTRNWAGGLKSAAAR